MLVVDLKMDAEFLASLLPEARKDSEIPVILDPQCSAGLEIQNMTRNEFKLCKEGENCARKLHVQLDRFTADDSTRSRALRKLVYAIKEFWDEENNESFGAVYISY